MRPHRPARRPGQPRQGDRLHRQDREDAGHQVQDQPAQRGEQQRLPQRQAARRRHRPRCGRDAVGAAHAPGIGDGDDALDAGGQGIRPSARQAEPQRAVAHRHRLRRGIVEEVDLQREEEGVPHRAGGDRRAGEFHGAMQPLETGARGEGTGAGFGRFGGGDDRAGHRVRTRRGLDRDVEAERARLGDADLLADQPGGVGGQREGLARRQPGRRRDRDDEDGLAFIAEIHQRAERDPLRRGEAHRAGARAVRQRQRHLRRLAGVAGIDPVGMPARGQALAQRDPEGLAGRDGRLVRHQRHGGAWRGDRRALDGARRGGKGHHGGEEGDQARHRVHEGPGAPLRKAPWR